MSTRKEFIKNAGLALVGSQTLPLVGHAQLAPTKSFPQTLCRWCFPDFTIEELCQVAKQLGIEALELLDPEETAITKKYGLQCMSTPKVGGLKTLSFDNFWNVTSEHDKLVAFYEEIIPRAANAGIPYILCFSGKGPAQKDYSALLNCKKGIQRILKTAEKYKVTISLEMLNSKDSGIENYHADFTEWAVILCEMISSPNFKLIYDVYHMHMMEGDVINTIKKYHSYFCHYHVGGVPGRNEIDETQEINYKAIAKAIADTGYKGFIGHEYFPKAKDKEGQIAAIKKSMEFLKY